MFLCRQTDTYPLETKRQRCRRYLSLAVIMFSLLVSSIGKYIANYHAITLSLSYTMSPVLYIYILCYVLQ